MAVFAQLTDLHLRPPGVLTLGRIDADRHAAAAIDRLLLRHGDIDAVIVTGDIADIGEEDAYTRAEMLLSRFSVPVLVMPGNHDRTAALRAAFIAWPGVVDEPVAGKLCHAREIGGVMAISLDTSVDGLDTRSHHGTLGPAQLAWLDETLAGCGPALIAMHHPPFRTGTGMDGIGLSDADAFAAVLARHRNVARIICGHVHRVIIGDVAGVTSMAVPGVAHQVALSLGEDRAQLVMEPPAYAIHIVEEGNGVSHVGYVDDYGAPVSFAEMAANAAPPQ
ncbi:phosphodiesterase [Acuticoccus sp. MNP-M23]|uniref:phosphodiesterase n=1 Tax=Acuticoccus sp. MNP-M23 TaxID=3072793 RepID=UPI0028163034|nr:phosphodiesterase [Acuticoccus sp. MNP-M23]WMS42949.1 phosphodiesterase [Acuticoccus sp. MNP-M23]